MPRFKDRTNDRYGRLTVISHAGKDHRGKHLWLCKCDCGKTKEVVSDNLSSGKSKSCGCLKAEFLSSRGNQFGLYENREDAMIKVQYSHMQRRNKKLGFDDSISFDTFKSLVKSPCKYCGLEFSKEIEDRLNEKKDDKRLSDHILKCNGIDRVDNGGGYVDGNCVPCCKFCNFAKHVMSEQEFYEWVRRTYTHLFGTTGVAAKNLNRKFIGVERDIEYFNIANGRILND